MTDKSQTEGQILILADHRFCRGIRMTKRTLLLLLLWCVLSLGASAQYNCASSTKLVCQIPFATGGSTAGATAPLTNAVAFNAPIAAQLSQLPLVSSASGVTIIFDKANNPIGTTENLGPILTEQAQTIGRHRLFLGFSFQQFNFNSIDGIGLGRVPFVYQAAAGNVSQYIQETEHISFKFDQYIALATFGLTSRTDFTMVLPFERVSIGSGATMGTAGTQYFVGPAPNYQQLGTGPSPQPYVVGSASGIGDILFNIKQWFYKGERTNIAGGFLMRLPTGDALNYLGSGAYGYNPYAVLSYQLKPWISPHARIGYQWNTNTVLVPNGIRGPSRLPGGFQYDVGADTLIWKKFSTTLAADLLGYYVVNSPYLIPTTTSIPGYGLTFPNLEKVTKSYNWIRLALELNEAHQQPRLLDLCQCAMADEQRRPSQQSGATYRNILQVQAASWRPMCNARGTGPTRNGVDPQPWISPRNLVGLSPSAKPCPLPSRPLRAIGRFEAAAVLPPGGESAICIAQASQGKIFFQ